ncbi:MAG: outer membrane protein transport protein, partial [Albidovulum sp.]|uniref:OmpP1/FadL family transporter n=1 Tax=Albidovulum sp. TaxID=1872424 RepID=UPI003CBFADC0
MKKVSSIAAVVALSATTAVAGGVDRSGQSTSILFEQGNYLEFSLGSVSPSVSGTAVALPFPGLQGAKSGDMSGDYTQFSAGYKHRFSNSLEAAVIIDKPFGADVDYPVATALPAYYANGSTATLKSSAITGILKYKTPQNISIFGGLRYQTLSAEASIPFIATYNANGSRDGGLGYLVGVAWEKPEIAARVALTYNSKIKHKLDTAETSLATLGATLTSVTEVETPQSVNLEFQTGIAADTLLFGSIRWVEWSAFDITPAHYQAITGGASLVSYDDDTISYSLGVGRKFNENWSAAVTLGYEKPTGGFSSNLGPTDGYRSIGLGATYTMDNVKITGGVRYVDIGDTQTQLGAIQPSADFKDNDAVAWGIRIG